VIGLVGWNFAVEKPREQVADAEALLDLTRTLFGSVRSLANEGVTPSQFVSSLLIRHGQGQDSIDWQKLGLAVSPIFLSVHGSSTMSVPLLYSFHNSIILCSYLVFFYRLGPMDNEFKKRRTGVRKHRDPRPTVTTRPEQVTPLFIFLGHSYKTLFHNVVTTCFKFTVHENKILRMHIYLGDTLWLL